MKTDRAHRAIAGICAIAVCLGLTACNNRPTTQNAAALVKVNGQEITARDVQEAMADAIGKRVTSEEVLEGLVDQKLLEDEAVRLKLERDPQVEAAIESAKARILSQAYLERKAALNAQPTQREIDDYFNKHPEQFAERKLVDFNVLAIDSKDKNDEFKRVTDAAKSLDDVAAWLDGRNAPYARSRLVRSSAELPPALAERVRSQSNTPLVMTEGATTLIVEVASVTSSPLKREEAQARIVRELADIKSREIAKTEVARLRSLAKLDYLNRPVSRVAGAHAGNVDTGRIVSE